MKLLNMIVRIIALFLSLGLVAIFPPGTAQQVTPLLPAPGMTSVRLSDVTQSVPFNSSSPAPWGGYGTTLWAKGPSIFGSTSSPVLAYTFGGHGPTFAHNQLTVWNGSYTLMAGSTNLLRTPSRVTGSVISAAFDPGARVAPIRWTYQNKLYLFGGEASANYTDIWSFNGTYWTQEFPDLTTNYGQGGVPSTPLWPPNLAAAAHAFDGSHTLWVHGGYVNGSIWAAPQAVQDDLWSFDMLTSQWTWRTGSAGGLSISANLNVPLGAACMFIDAAGNIWIYGGQKGDLYNPAEMWVYFVGNNTWYLKNNYTTDFHTIPVYPTGGIGVFEAGAHPGGRVGSAYWTDPTRQFFFIFSGEKADQYLWEDGWVYDVNRDQWAWIFGDQYFGAQPPYTIDNLNRTVPIHRALFGFDIDESATNLYVHGGDIGGGEYTTDLYMLTISNLPPTNALTTTPPVETTTAVVTTPASGVGCFGTAPLGAVCVNGVWDLAGDVSLTDPNTQIDLKNKTVLIRGNVTITSNATLLVTPASVLNVTGCVSFSGNVQLTIDPVLAQDGTLLPVITSNSSCTTLAGNVSAPTIVYPNGAVLCKQVTGTYATDGKSVSVLLAVKNTCTKKTLKWWAYVAIVVGVILVTAAVVLVIVFVFYKPKQRKRFGPPCANRVTRSITRPSQLFVRISAFRESSRIPINNSRSILRASLLLWDAQGKPVRCFTFCKIIRQIILTPTVFLVLWTCICFEIPLLVEAVAVPALNSTRLSTTTHQSFFNSSSPAPWGGWGSILWAKGPSTFSNTPAAPNVWMFGGSGPNFYHNIFTLYTNGTFNLVSGSLTQQSAQPLSTVVPLQPGSRDLATRWTYQNKLYLFGGDSTLFYNDIWSYDGNAWVQEFLDQPESTTWPGCLTTTANVFDDKRLKLWIFGGFRNSSASASIENDLWSFDLPSSTWTLYSSALALVWPLPLAGACMWMDSAGDLWIYGGERSAFVSYPAEMWKYTVSTSSWTMVYNKSNSILTDPVYPSSQGVWGAAAHPGSRYSPAYWTDPSRQLFFLFAGAKSDQTSEFYEDVWVYDPASGQWAWIFGDSGVGPSPLYYNATYLDRQRPIHRTEPGHDVDPSGTMVFIHGGDCGSGYFVTDLYMFTMSNLPVVTTLPQLTTTAAATSSQPANTTSSIGCVGTAPLGAVCVNSVWEVSGDVTVTDPNTQIDLTNKTVHVLGNVTITSNATLLVTTTSVLSVTGCVSFSGNVQLTIDPLEVQDGSSIPLINSNCTTIAPNISAPTITYLNGPVSCKDVKGTYASEGQSLSVLLSVKNSCKKSALKWWAYLLIGVGVVLLTIGIILVVFFCVYKPKVRRRMRLATLDAITPPVSTSHP